MKRFFQSMLIGSFALGLLVDAFSEQAFAQRGRGGGGDRSSGNRGGAESRGGGGGGPSMSRPSPRPGSSSPGGLGAGNAAGRDRTPGAGPGAGAGGGLGGGNRGPGAGPGAGAGGGLAGTNRGPGAGAGNSLGGAQRPGGLNPAGGSKGPSYQRPGSGSARPGMSGGGLAGNDRPNAPGGGLAGNDRPNAPGSGLAGNGRPNAPGGGLAGNDRPANAGDRFKPGAGNGASASQLNDFLGQSNSSSIGDRRPGSTTLNGNNQLNNRVDASRDKTVVNSNNEVTNRVDASRDKTVVNSNNEVTNRFDASRDKTVVNSNNQVTNRIDASRDTNVVNRNNQVNNRVDAGTDVNIGQVNIDKSINYQKNQQAWVDNRHVAGDSVRVNAGSRYYDSYRTGDYRRGVVDGYQYANRWDNSAVNNAWVAPTFAAVGAFVGASVATTQPVYYGYGTGGNVYYEQNTVYVNGEAAGTPTQYAEQAMQQVVSAPPPEQVADVEWLPLGVFALTEEDSSDSNTMIELAVSKSGVLAGTYYNESTQVSRPLKGTVDTKSQRAVVGFADGKNPEVTLDTGLYNLTQDEAPSLLHRGLENSSPILLVRLQAPEQTSPQN